MHSCAKVQDRRTEQDKKTESPGRSTGRQTGRRINRTDLTDRKYQNRPGFVFTHWKKSRLVFQSSNFVFQSISQLSATICCQQRKHQQHFLSLTENDLDFLTLVPTSGDFIVLIGQMLFIFALLLCFTGGRGRKVRRR